MCRDVRTRKEGKRLGKMLFRRPFGIPAVAEGFYAQLEIPVGIERFHGLEDGIFFERFLDRPARSVGFVPLATRGFVTFDVQRAFDERTVLSERHGEGKRGDVAGSQNGREARSRRGFAEIADRGVDGRVRHEIFSAGTDAVFQKRIGGRCRSGL